jgi:hypothetical protein
MDQLNLLDLPAIGVKPTRIVRVELTKEQIGLLIDYALRDGFERKHPGRSWDTQEENLAAKWAIVHKLGLDNAK